MVSTFQPTTYALNLAKRKESYEKQLTDEVETYRALFLASNLQGEARTSIFSYSCHPNN
jgi:hypothetical protein